MKLREDSDPYCLLWIGVVLLAAYYFNFLYFSTSLLTTYLPSSLILLVLPILQIFFFIAYLKPDRSRAKTTMLSIAVIFTFFVIVFAGTIPEEFYGGLYLASWATGAALVTAGGFSLMHTLEESTTLGILDVGSLHYGPEPTQQESETPTGTVEAESGSAATQESS
ncbi:MAG: hypothetical protein EAX95_15400 [Candidatus Thorarchaeota archaeon]|nr:hypothetical protein [Candidatus Thorarchaeota archaeon]